MCSAPLLLITCALAFAAPEQAGSSTASLDRLRAALAQPPSRLTLPERKPDFTVDIRERQRFENLLPSILDFKVGPGVPQQSLFASPFGSQPLFRVDLLSMAMGAAAGINELRKAHARRSAVREVRRAILDFCAAQPNGGAGIQICSTAPAAR